MKCLITQFACNIFIPNGSMKLYRVSLLFLKNYCFRWKCLIIGQLIYLEQNNLSEQTLKMILYNCIGKSEYTLSDLYNLLLI